MVKNIYIIKNDINNMVYIGQAKNVHKRFLKHCNFSQYKSKLQDAIKLYGKEHFHYEILEYNIKDYKEREKYWIQYYNCIWPNGYNCTIGGESDNDIHGADHALSILNKEQVEQLTNDLLNTDMKLTDLAKKYGFNNVTSISDFNIGKNYARDDIDYPIRKEVLIGKGKLKHKDILNIIYLLKYTYRSYENIGKQFNVKWKTISNINKGIIHKQENEIYPIREGQVGSSTPSLYYEQVTEIINLIKNTNRSLRDIARQFNCMPCTIIGIKNGTIKLYRRKNLIYPLRSN